MRLAAIAWRGLAARPLRTALSAAGVALGVAVLTATIIAGSSSDQAVRSATQDLLGSADVRLRAFAESGFQPRTVQALRALPDVQAAAPVAERQLTVYTPPGEDERVFSLLVLGVDPEAEAVVRDTELSAGVPLSEASPTDALVPASWASRHGLALGDELLLGGRREGVPAMRIIGLMEDSGFGALAGGDVLVMQRSALDDAFEIPAPIRSIDLDLGEAPTEESVEAVTGTLTEPFVVETADDAASRLAAAQETFVGTALLFGLVALVVGGFLVGNTLAMTVGERIRELGLLRAAGMTSRQVVGIVLRQALALGIIGSAAGLVVGFLLAMAMIGFLSTTRAVLVAGVSVPIAGLAVAFLLGVVVTMAAALIPALRAAAVSPLVALRPSRRPDRSLGDRLLPLVAIELALVLGGIVVVALGGAGTPILPILLSLALLIGGAVATAFVLEPIGRVVGRPFEWFFGAQGLLGRANLSRDRVRTGLSVGAMMIGLAAVVALGTVAESARAGTERWVGSILPGGHAIRTSLPLEVDTFRQTFEATTGVQVASPVREMPVVRVTPAGPEEAWLAGIDPNVFQDAGALLVRGTDRADAFASLRAGGAALVPVSLAEREGIRVGNVIELARPGEQVASLTVAGLLEYTLPGRTNDGAILVSSADARDLFGATAASLWVMIPQPDIPDAAFVSAVRETAAGLAAQPVTARDLAGELSRSLDSLIGLFDALALIAVVIGGLGIVNTLGVGVSERVREIAILRSHGMTVGQVQAMVVAEAAIMGAIAGVLAIATGLVMAAALVGGGVSAELVDGLRVPWALLIVVILVGTGIAALAGLYPARVAASLPIVGNLKHFE